MVARLLPLAAVARLLSLRQTRPSSPPPLDSGRSPSLLQSGVLPQPLPSPTASDRDLQNCWSAQIWEEGVTGLANSPIRIGRPSRVWIRRLERRRSWCRHGGRQEAVGLAVPNQGRTARRQPQAAKFLNIELLPSKLFKQQRLRVYFLGCDWCNPTFPRSNKRTCALQFFQENLPNLSVVWNEKQTELELKWKDWDSHIFGDQRDVKILRASIASLPTIGGLQFSADSVQKNFIESTGFDFNDVAWSELPKGQMAGAADALQTPGAVSNRLSFGMTPKTVRLPKNGEMLLSVHGSPLGVYKEENLAAIRESGNGSEDATS